MIDRVIAPSLLKAAKRSPVVAVTGPRQSGKTTLCRSAFAEHAYVNLEPLDTRDFALNDPRGFLREHSGPVVFDEVQRVPELFSYLQEAVDEDPAPGRFVLTGSQHFGLSEAISQSLAGRVALLHLLPLSLDEVGRFGPVASRLWDTVWAGGYPRLFDQQLSPNEWLGDYITTYVQRDVRQLLNVSDLDAFTMFVRLAAGRTAQELNLSSLGGDVGVTHVTIRSWVSLLETSFIVHRLPPWLHNTRKRIVKAPKLHFVDTGLACHLLGIRSAEQLATHPLRGSIFESWVASEVLKARLHRRQEADLFHLRLSRGAEVDLIAETERSTIGVEVKSGETFTTGLARSLSGWVGADPDRVGRVVFGGSEGQRRSGYDVISWRGIQDVDWV